MASIDPGAVALRYRLGCLSPSPTVPAVAYRVPIMCGLRELLAGPVESFVLLDRQQFLRERGFAARVVPLFDPAQSPRNMVIEACRPEPAAPAPPVPAAES